MNGLDLIKLKAFSRSHIPNENPGGTLAWQDYHTVRNAIVKTCRQFGPTGPMGAVQIESDVEDPYRMIHDSDFWERGDSEPMYYVIEDQLNHERYCYMELMGNDPFNAGWLLGITATLRTFDGWGIGINNIPDSYMVIFGKKLMVKGRLAKCQSVLDVVETTRRLLKQGPKRWWQIWR
ncbi:MAG: hypothetical protein C0467_13390 [Planctomycetaceae bacterium]|nr:hypothetical protein [Planctomycetaceae bacterium]